MYQQLIAGIEYIHKSGICHRDLKPENLLLDYDKTLKIVDFGLSNMYSPSDNETLKTACGSPCYAAPEMIAGKKYHGLKSDIWSSGVVLYAMVCGFLPFEDPKTSNLYKKILAGEYKLPKFMSADCTHFMSKILNTDPETRYGVDEIRNHPWYKQMKDKQPEGLFPGKYPMPVNDKLYQQMLDEFNYDPDYSVKCIEANRHNQITATYHLLGKKALRKDKNFLDDDQNTTNMVGSLDRGKQQPTRLQQQQQLEKEKEQLKAKFGINSNNQGHKRGQSIAVGGITKENQPVSSIQPTTNMAALNITNTKNDDISAQKKYKIELQAEINKLRNKYQDYKLPPKPDVKDHEPSSVPSDRVHHVASRTAPQNTQSTSKGMADENNYEARNLNKNTDENNPSISKQSSIYSRSKQVASPLKMQNLNKP